MFPFSDKVYSYLKWAAAIAIPAACALVGAVGLSVSWGGTGAAVTVIAAVGTFIGALVGVSTGSYNKTKE
jgi:hypothetical protein